jgi:hypothetical protein
MQARPATRFLLNSNQHCHAEERETAIEVIASNDITINGKRYIEHICKGQRQKHSAVYGIPFKSSILFTALMS